MSRSCVAEIRANATEEAKGQDRRVAASAGHVSKQQRGHVGKRARMRRRQAVGAVALARLIVKLILV